MHLVSFMKTPHDATSSSMPRGCLPAPSVWLDANVDPSVDQNKLIKASTESDSVFRPPHFTQTSRQFPAMTSYANDAACCFPMWICHNLNLMKRAEITGRLAMYQCNLH
jgi:hypothetical protein